ncbi:MAG: hypothetical protein AAGL66_03640 [Pseudomonadota bacterium]
MSSARLRIFPVAELSPAHGVHAEQGAVQFGVPLPQGWCTDERRLTLVDERDDPINADVRALARWPDQSIQWCLLHCRPSLSADSALRVGLVQDPQLRDPVQDDFISEHAGYLRIPGTRFDLHVSTQRLALFDVVGRDGELEFEGFCELRAAEELLSTSVYRYEYRSRCGPQGVVSHEVTRYARLEGSQDLDISVRCELCVSGDGRRIDGRISLHNKEAAAHPNGLWDLGDPYSFRFDGLSTGLRPSSATSKSFLGGDWLLSGSAVQTYSQSVRVTQYSSGGENWDSPVHVAADGLVRLRKRGFEASIDGQRHSGLRAQPRVRWRSGDRACSVESVAGWLPQFWEQFPGELKSDRETISISPFAIVGSEHELQAGERKTRSFTFLLGSEAALPEPADGTTVKIDPDHLRSCRLPMLGDFDAIDPDLEALTVSGIDGDESFFAKREAIDEFGWRHFGDLYADHETDGYEGERSFVSHYNNQYDAVYGFLRRYLYSGDPRWFELGHDLARHVLDIDIYQTTKDRPEYNHGLFWHTDHYLPAETSSHRSYSKDQRSGAYEGHAHGGGPGGQHCYTTGLLLHYLLTGDEDSKAGVYGLSEWISRVYEGDERLVDVALALRNRKRRDLKNHLNGRYPLDRGVANYINALLDCHVLDPSPYTLRRVEHILRNTLHPAENIAERDLGDVEANWYYVVLLQALCRFLHTEYAKTGASDAFLFARDALLHYADWMVENEHPYLDRPEILEFPNHTWTAQDLRKANVLFEAGRWTPSDPEPYYAKADSFANHVRATLEAEPTCHYTRIQVLLLQNLAPTRRPCGHDTDRLPARNSWTAPRPSSPLQQIGNLLSMLLRALRGTKPGDELKSLGRLLAP